MMTTTLDYIVLLLGNIANAYMIDNFFGNFFEAKDFAKGKLKKILYVLFFAAVMFGVNLFQSALINVLVVPSLILLYVAFIYMGSIGSRLVYFVITICILIGSELIFAILLGLPYYIAGQIDYIEISSLTMEIFILKLATYFMFAVVKQISGKAKEHMPSKIFGMYMCLPLATIGILVLTYHSGLNVIENIVVRIFLIICSALMFLGNIMIFYAFHQHTKESYQKSQLELMIMKREMEWKHQVQMLEQNEERQKFIHDINNHLIVLGGLVDEKQNFRMAEIIRELRKNVEKSEEKVYCQNPILNILLSEKVAEAKRQEIEVDIFVEPNICTGKIRDIDLISALGNLLDNAIRGASECEERRIQIKLFIEKGMFVANIINGFNGEIKLEGSQFLTTKSDMSNHGLGIKSVEDIAEKYNGNLTCRVVEKEFHALLFLSLF